MRPFLATISAALLWSGGAVAQPIQCAVSAPAAIAQTDVYGEEGQELLQLIANRYTLLIGLIDVELQSGRMTAEVAVPLLDRIEPQLLAIRENPVFEIETNYILLGQAMIGFLTTANDILPIDLQICDEWLD